MLKINQGMKSISEEKHHELYNILHKLEYGSVSYIYNDELTQRHFWFYYGKYFSLSGGWYDVVPFRSQFSYDEMHEILSNLVQISYQVDGKYIVVWDNENGLVVDIDELLATPKYITMNSCTYSRSFLTDKMDLLSKQSHVALFKKKYTLSEIIFSCPPKANLYVDYPGMEKYDVFHSDGGLYSRDGDFWGNRPGIVDDLTCVKIILDHEETILWSKKNGTQIQDGCYYVVNGSFFSEQKFDEFFLEAK